MKKIIVLVVVLFEATQFSVAQVCKYVNPFIGVDGGGNTFPGASLPFGMVKLGPDMEMNHAYPNTNSGYSSNKKLYGFSHTHVSGTGGGAKYGNVRVIPLVGSVNRLDYRTRLVGDESRVGYYFAKLPDYGISAELTCTHSVGYHRYTFPSSDSSVLMIDAGAMLLRGSEFQFLENSEIQVISKSEISGWSCVGGGWNCGKPYTVYFYALTDTPCDTFGTWKNRRLTTGTREEKLTIRYGDTTEKNTSTGAFFIFNTQEKQQVQLKVGISFVSIEKAKQNLFAEAPEWNFDVVRQRATNQWETILSKIRIEGGTEPEKQMFYTAMYHSFLMPVNRTGEYPVDPSFGVYYDDYYAIWDTYRTVHPLITLIDENRQAEMLNSLIKIGNKEGYMPDSRSGNSNGRTQGGSNCDILFADAYLKGIKGIDYENAYKLMVKNAEEEPERARNEGRGGISDYKRLGYVPFEIERAGTRTVEYSHCDYALYVLANGLLKNEDIEKYKKRASNWTNLWNPIEEYGATGFIWPKYKNGMWETNFSTRKWGSWTDFFYESHSWEYSLSFPHDVQRLMNLSGGKDKFVARLDTFFIKGFYQVQNEPGFFSPCLYIWAGRPDKTAERVSIIRDRKFTSKRNGIPGNDDAGAMSSWYVFHAMGFYPNAGTNYYLISGPKFPEVNFTMTNGKSIRIIAKNAESKNIYIQRAKLNGKKLERAWFTHDEIKNGAIFEFVMGPKPSKWAFDSCPPSLTDSNTLN